MVDAVPGGKQKPAILVVLAFALLSAVAIGLAAMMFLLPGLQPSAPVAAVPLKPVPFKADARSSQPENPAAALDPAASARSGLTDALLQDRVMTIMRTIQRKTKDLKANEPCDPALIADELADFEHDLAEAADPWGQAAMRARQLHVMVLVRCQLLPAACEELQGVLPHVDARMRGQLRLRLGILLAQQHETQRVDELVTEADQDAGESPERVDLHLLQTVAYTQVGHPFFNFAMPDLQGANHSLSDYRGHPLLVHFWMTASPECDLEIPRLVALYNRHHRDGLEMLGFDCDGQAKPDDKDVAMMPWPQVNARAQWPGAKIGPFGVQGLPGAFLIGSDGVLIAQMGSVADQNEAIERAVADTHAPAGAAH